MPSRVGWCWGSFPMRAHRVLGKLLENDYACEADFAPAPGERFDGLVWTPYHAKIVDGEARGGFLRLDSEHCVLSAVKIREDGAALVVRFYDEGQRRTGEVTLRLRFVPRKVASVDLLEEPLAVVSPVVITGKTVRLPVRPHPIVTLRIS